MPSHERKHDRTRRERRDAQPPQVAGIARARKIGVAAAGATLALGAVVGLLMFARPQTSEVERRTLTAFPALTWGGFWDGSFFSDLSLWYSDTYPAREQLVAANKAIDALHGVHVGTQMVGTAKQADELPPADQPDDQDNAAASVPSHSILDDGPVEFPTQEEMAAAVQDQITDGLYVKGDAAYNIYYFSQEATQEYADMVNALSQRFAGQAEVYSIIVPNASGIQLSDQEVKDLGGTNQIDAIRYFYSLYDDDVHAVDVVTPLKEHADEYIYYRTDHHWTALGSYYGYLGFCKEKDIEPQSLDDMEYLNVGSFLGSFASTLNSDEMAANPDYMEAWIPSSTNRLTLIDTDGSQGEYPIVADTSSEGVYGKSLTFIMGDQPLEKIKNPLRSDGSSCLVIKDSFADSFVPFLVDRYDTVWVADFRYFEGSYEELVEDEDIQDVIVLNNISLAGGGAVARAILGRL